MDGEVAFVKRQRDLVKLHQRRQAGAGKHSIEKLFLAGLKKKNNCDVRAVSHSCEESITI